ncbi:MAG TPA: threonylcarbamoyl-AMP synthase [Dehalococcoidia bacterium]|nr:threonylcarbamoyl-AMP synthase [Dehalococcoidia bacterium]
MVPDKAAPGIEEQVDMGVGVLKSGGLVAFPTDTVYGLGACYNDYRAVERIFNIKKRPRSKALPLLLAEVSQIAEVAEYVPLNTWILAKYFMPGALTLVLPKAAKVPNIVTADSKTVAVRVSPHPVPVSLIRGVGVPIIGTSVNESGQPSAITADEVRLQLRDKIDLVINGGRCPGGIESTIVDVTGKIPRVLREGAISRKELAAVCRII